MELEDGGFFDIKSKLSFLDEQDFTQVSMRLLEDYGYFRDDKIIRLGEFINLTLQARTIVLNNRKSGSLTNYVYSGNIVIPKW